MADHSHKMHLFWEIILAIILPPLGVFFRHGLCSWPFWICVVLTVLGYIPGIIYAIYAIVVKSDHHHQNQPEGYYQAVA